MTARLLSLAALAAATLAAPSVAAPAAKPPSFAICAVCHKVAAGETSALGPNLWGVGNRKAGATAFAYSPAMKTSKLKWDKPTLVKFITAPQQVVPGTRMAFAGQKNPQQAEAIADYLLSLK